MSYSKISVNFFIGSSLWGPSHQEAIRGKADLRTWPKQCGGESIEPRLLKSFHNKTLWRGWEPGMILLKFSKNIFNPSHHRLKTRHPPSRYMWSKDERQLKQVDIWTSWRSSRKIGECNASDRICIDNSMICSDIWHKYREWYFEILIRNFTSPLASEFLRQFWNNYLGWYLH